MKTVLSIVFVMVAVMAMGQEKKAPVDDVYFTPVAPEKKQKGQLAQEANVNRIVECLANYHKERKTALIIGVAAAGAITGAAFTDGDAQQALYVGGAVLGVASAGLYIHAERWIGKNKLLYTGNGVAIKF